MIYAYVVMIGFSLGVDFVLLGNKSSVQILVFSQKYKEIADHMISNLDRGVTALQSVGWYSQAESKVLLIISRKYQMNEVVNEIKKIDKKAAIVYLEVDVAALTAVADQGIHYEGLSKYPGMEVDLTFRSDRYAPIKAAIEEANSPLLKKVKVADLYRGEDGNAITVRLSFGLMDRTLTREEVLAVTDGIVANLAQQGICLK